MHIWWQWCWTPQLALVCVDRDAHCSTLGHDDFQCLGKCAWGANQMTVIEVPHIQLQVRRQAPHHSMPRHCKEQWAEGIPLLHPTAAAQPMALSLQGGMLTIANGYPRNELGCKASDLLKDRVSANAVECIPQVNLQDQPCRVGGVCLHPVLQPHGNCLTCPRRRNPTLVPKHGLRQAL